MQRILASIVFCFSLVLCGNAFAGSGHYVSGAEGIRAASLPPPGTYWRMYNMFYTADRLKDNSGRRVPVDFDVDVYALANRFIYSSEIELLGGNLVMDMVIPLVNTNISMRDAGLYSFSDNMFNLGDIMIEPLLISWHGDRYDAATGVGVYMPTGYYSSDRPASSGKGFWTIMFTAGGTVYFDEAKEWSASILSRYETHTQQEETRQTMGDRFHFEWGVGKNFNQMIDVGVAGYCYWQVTDDSGRNASDDREKAYAIGPEIGFVIPPVGVNVSIRSLWEFENRGVSQGNMTTLTLTKRF